MRPRRSKKYFLSFPVQTIIAFCIYFDRSLVTINVGLVLPKLAVSVSVSYILYTSLQN